jgi:hypothetical protein
MMGFKIDSHSVRMEHRLQSIGYLLPNTFLYCEAFGKQAHQARELGNTNDVLVGDVRYVGMPMKWEGMMLAQAKKVDRSLHYLAQPAVRATTTFSIKHREQLGITIITLGGIEQGPKKALRCPQGSWGAQI